MKQYFEFKNESSSKFWEISLEKDTITTRYGKIGTAGKKAEKVLKSNDLAEKEYKKLIKSKVKKGYEEVATTSSASTAPILTEKKGTKVVPKTKNAYRVQLLTNEAAIEQFNLKEYDPFGQMGFESVLLLEGDAEIDGDLDYQWYQKEAKKLKQEGDYALILVDGNLIVHGDISPGADSMPCLFVTGDVTCEALRSYDECIYIKGDATIKYAFDGNYNDGSIVIEGTTKVPYVLNSDHCSSISPEGAILINYYGDDDDFFDYDYTTQDFERVMVSKVLDEDDELDTEAFINLLRAGKSPLRKGAKPARILFEEALAKIVKKSKGKPVTSLDLAGKKFSSFPKDILKLTDLKTLILSNNPILELPEEISLLTNLEELYLESCSLEQLPTSIGALKHLRVLDVSRNSPLQLPDSINQLKQLEELYVRSNQGFGFPKDMRNLQKLRVLDVYQCSGTKPIDFPEIICSLKGLEELNLGNNSFKTIPDSFVNLKKLEDLKLGASLCYLDKLPDLSGLTNLKRLSADGLTSYTTRPRPKQSLLKAFFKISSLEVLGIDRHGESKNTLRNSFFEELLENLEHDPARQAAMKEIYTPKGKNAYYGTVWEGIARQRLKAKHLEGIGNLKNLRELDLSFNGLEELPEELLSLDKLEKINLSHNDNLSMDDLKRLYEKFPKAAIDAKKIRTRVDIDDDNFKAVNALVKTAAGKMRAQNYQASLELFEEALKGCTPGEKYSEYDELYAHYGICYNLSYLLFKCKSKKAHKAMVTKLLRYGKKTFKEFIPEDAFIWHYTEEGAFQRECVRIIGNALGWHLFSDTDDVAILEEALYYAERANGQIDGIQHFFIRDTLVRILLKLGRKEEAYQLVAKTLKKYASFSDFQDIKKDKEYKKWRKKML
ncbi:MAG: Unknown protein [uncultured Aureispira sp.]|uniref:WGR domain-containing protein n=1 Tax=uncultured Aureispira sp. TaxID=1331704 RepID=A0A6S6S3W8_9BACT|nr:MAG: Unknown protein [uncultured Aureispira sp.]